MLECKSGDPHFIMPVDLEKGERGRARYLDDFETLRWSHGRMDKTIDMGGVGQCMLKKVLWAKFFLLWDQTSWLWATTELFDYMFSRESARRFKDFGVRKEGVPGEPESGDGG